MKQIKHKIIFAAISFAIIGCNNTGIDLNQDTELFKNVIDYNLNSFKKYKPATYQSDEYYQKSLLLVKTSDNIVDGIQKSNILYDSIKTFVNQVNTISDYCKISITSSEFQDLIKNRKSELKYKIKVYETIAINALFQRASNRYIPMESTTPVVVAKRNEINLGEEFKAEIFIAGINPSNKYLVVINDDTLKYDKDFLFPIFKEKPNRKGERILNGYIKFYNPNTDHEIKYDFSYNYIVK